MKRDILIISDALVEPPTEPLIFRAITMFSHEFFEMNVLLHSTQDMKDIFYKWMKPRGLMDYVDYILHEKEWEEGIRIDVVKFYPDTIMVKALRIENERTILGRIRSMTGH
jgi:hypothetical protein